MASRDTLPGPPRAPVSDHAFVHYYDQHPTREDLMEDSLAQSKLVFYLLQVLGWLYRAEGWLVANNLNIYLRRRKYEQPLAPDIAVFKGVVVASPNERALRSWRLYEPGCPPPQVVFEISSESTWKEDLESKPVLYATLGVQEYYAYDPNEPPYWPASAGRLRGWRRVAGVLVEQSPDAQGRLWSEELASWLVADGAYLRLCDAEGQLRMTEGEAERTAREAERIAKEAAWARLRALGIDPE